MKIQSRGYEITTEELRADVQSAKTGGAYWPSAFCPETVEALLDLLDLYAQQNQDNADENERLREANRRQFERIVWLERREQALYECRYEPDKLLILLERRQTRKGA